MIILELAKLLGRNIETIQAVVRYLKYYGHLGVDPSEGPQTTDTFWTHVRDALKKVQTLGGLAPTGDLNGATLDLLSQPRCGCSDVQRLNAQAARWRKTSLTYYVQEYVGSIPRGEQDEILALAWKHWTDVCGIKVSKATSGSAPDIVISTGRGRQQQFDGPSGTLAWAYLPTGSDQQLLMRFDLDETWASGTGRGILMLNVACHEFGHLLGLDHSRASGALMAPFYAAAIAKPQANDDVPRIQQLYGLPAGGDLPIDPKPVPATRRVTLEIQADGPIRDVQIVA